MDANSFAKASSVDILKVFDWWFFKMPNLVELSSLPSREELAAKCDELETMLAVHREYILTTGLMPLPFPSDRLLERCFRRFCDTRKTSSPIPIVKNDRDFQGTYTFLKVLLSDHGRILEQTPVPFEQASFLERLIIDDLEFFENIRPNMFSLSKDLIDVALVALRKNLPVANFYKLVLDKISIKLNSDDFLRLLGIESKFRKTLPPTNDFEFDGGMVLGGEGILNNLISFVAYVANVLVLNISADDRFEFQQVLSIKSFDQLIEIKHLEKLEVFFSKTERIAKENEVFLKGVDSWLVGLPFPVESGAMDGSFFPIASAPIPTIASGHSYVFRRSGRMGVVLWEMSFNGKSKNLPDQVGFYYIQQLLANPGKNISRLELDRQKTLLEIPISRLSDEDFFEEDVVGKEDRVTGMAFKHPKEIEHELQLLNKSLKDEELTGARKSEIEEAILVKNNELLEARSNQHFYDKTVNRVHEAFKRAMNKISQMHPELAYHLKNSIKFESGAVNSYCPTDISISWSTANID